MQSISIITPALKSGGLERVVSMVANELSNKDDLRIYLIVLSIGEIFYPLHKKVKLILPESNIYNRNKLTRAILTAKWLRNNIRTTKTESVLSFGEGYNSFVIASLLGLSCKIFVFNRASPLSSLKGLRGLINPYFYKKADGVVVQTDLAVTLLKRKYRNSKFIVIGNPFFFNGTDDLKKENIILNVGSFTGLKNQKKLIYYFSQLQNIDDWKLYFVGDGPKRLECENYVRELHLNEKVKFLGKRRDVECLYGLAKIFAFTSESEGFPNVLGEAMTFGLSAISFDCIAGPSELIEHGSNGFLIPLDDDSAYIRHLQLLCDDGSLRQRMGENAKTFMKNFDSDKIIGEYLSLIKN